MIKHSSLYSQKTYKDGKREGQKEILDKIRSEIEQKLDTHGYISLYNKAINDVLKIIDEYRTESEEYDGE